MFLKTVINLCGGAGGKPPKKSSPLSDMTQGEVCEERGGEVR